MKRKLWSAVLTLCMVMSICVCVPVTVSAETSGTCGENLTWVLDDEGTLTISGTGEMNSHPWDEESVRKAVIENGVTSIGYEAFYNCSSLTEITLPDSVTSIGDYAFCYCSSLIAITLSDNVTSIGSGAFLGCDRMERIEVEKDNENFKTKNGVLFDRKLTTLIQYPAGNLKESYTIPNSVTNIGTYAFTMWMHIAVKLLWRMRLWNKQQRQDCNMQRIIQIQLLKWRLLEMAKKIIYIASMMRKIKF